jgi:hypothetical protein
MSWAKSWAAEDEGELLGTAIPLVLIRSSSFRVKK